MFDNLDISVKSVIGVILLIFCFIYILRRPGMSMMDSLKEQQKKKMEKEQKIREALEKAEGSQEPGGQEPGVPDKAGKTGETAGTKDGRNSGNSDI